MKDLKKLGLLGEGAYAKVFLVEDPQGIQFALKEYSLNVAKADEQRAYFKAESVIYGKELSNNVVKLYEFWEEENKLCLLFEYCEYGCLKHQLREKGPFNLRKTLKVGICTLNALASLHKENIVHRDVKPNNILQGRKGILKLADLGLAKVDGLPDAKCPHGSVAYISPEQYLNYNNVDFRSDIYSVGATLYHLYTGKEVYSGKDLSDILDSHQNCVIPNIRDLRPDCPLSFNHIIRKMISKNPADRYQSAEEAFTDLSRVLEGISTIHELPSIKKFKEEVNIQENIETIPDIALVEEERNNQIALIVILLSVVIVLCLIFLI
ncbi:MAG: serine/threonine protein kinase [Lentisphaerales bacterium]|nr:serine/threonine protein kinase [Lentisphaerales bacterium]